MQESLKVHGPVKLSGSVNISGAKNSALPILAASLLSDSPVILENVPNLQDIANMLGLLSDLGSSVTFCNNDLIKLTQSSRGKSIVPFSLVKKMRASVLVLGPLLAKFGEVVLALPGGCAIGSRPIDIHLSGLEKMGVKLNEFNGYVYAKSNGRLKGAEINCHTVSVTATENLMMAASLADGVTKISNAACEPEVVDLGNFLISLGAKIYGLGTPVIKIKGVKSLNNIKNKSYKIIPDRIEAGTYLIAAAITKGKVHLKGIRKDHLNSVLDALVNAGVNNIKFIGNSEIICDASNINLNSVSVDTAVYPGFPTDMQAQLMSLNLVAKGNAKISETIFENRFMHVPELKQLGGKVEIDGRTASIKGEACLMGAPVEATDLRASASLVLAALAACGETVIHKIYHLDRGYCQMELKLSQLGVKVSRVLAV